MSIRRFRKTDVHALAGAYVLDALAGTGLSRFERHLARCEDCAQEVRGMREAAAALGSAVSAPPPARMRERVLAAAARTRPYPPLAAAHRAPGHRTRDHTAPGHEAAGGWPPGRWPAGRRARVRPGRRRPGAWPPRLAAAMAAVFLAAAVALGALMVTMAHRLDRADQRSRQVTAVLTARDATMMTAPVATGGRATVVMSHAKRMIVFSAKGLRDLPGTRAYELWLMGPGGVRPAGMLPRPSHGMTSPMVVSGVAVGDTVGMTVEPGGGSPRPTTPPVLVLGPSS